MEKITLEGLTGMEIIGHYTGAGNRVVFEFATHFVVPVAMPNGEIVNADVRTNYVKVSAPGTNKLTNFGQLQVELTKKFGQVTKAPIYEDRPVRGGSPYVVCVWGVVNNAKGGTGDPNTPIA